MISVTQSNQHYFQKAYVDVVCKENMYLKQIIVVFPLFPPSVKRDKYAFWKTDLCVMLQAALYVQKIEWF